jgi:hypothetical protein
MAEKIPDTIPQIGPATLALLRQRGIETNLDVLYTEFPSALRRHGDVEDWNALKRIPGLGPGREALLREWAQRVYLTQMEKERLESHEQQLAARRAEEARSNAVYQAQRQQEVAKRRAEEVKQKWNRTVLIGTIIGFLCLFVPLSQELDGFVFAAIIAGGVAGALGLLAKLLGEAVLTFLE